MMLREAKQTIRQWIRRHFDDQKLAAVYAYNSDGKMFYNDPCGCILGVTLTKGALHSLFLRTTSCNCHYTKAKYILPAGVQTERAYALLGNYDCQIPHSHNNDTLRRVRLSAILRWEMRRRERERSASTSLQPEGVCVEA